MQTKNNPFRARLGLLGVDQTAHVWINDESGMSTELVSDLVIKSDWAISSSEGRTPLDAARIVWEGVHRLAYSRLIGSLTECIAAEFAFPAITGKSTPVARINPKQVRLISTAAPGLLLTVPAASEMLLTLRSIQFLANAVRSSDLKANLSIYDLDRQLPVFNRDYEISHGLNTLTLDITYNSSPFDDTFLLISLQADAADLVLLSAPGWASPRPNTLKPLIKPVEIPANGPDYTTSFNLSHALFCDAELRYDMSKLVARWASDLLRPYTFIAAALLLNEKRGTPNMSMFTMSSPEFTKQQEAMMFNLFQSSLKPVAKQIVDELSSRTVLAPAPVLPSQNRVRSGSYV